MKRGLCCRPVLVDCIHTADDIVKLLVRPGRPITLVFFTPAPIPIPRRSPSARAQNTRGGEIGDFLLKSPFISETVRDRSMVAMEH